MAFDYDQLKAKAEGEGSFWASYSDLFMVLSLVFLLLYVVAGLRSGTYSIKSHMEYQELKKQNADFKEQIKAYNTLKEDYLSQGATQSEMKTYEKLMGKLSLLKEEAKEEKNQLRKKAQENAEKEEALNQYQQIVRNIINTNMLSAARMKRKDKVIVKIDKNLEQKKKEVKQLNSVVAQKQQEIEQKREEIEKANETLDQKVSQLQKAYQQNKITKAMMDAKLKKVKSKAQKQIQELEAKTDSVENELNQAMASLSSAKQEIEQKDQTIAQKNTELSALELKKRQTEQEIAQMKDDFREDRAKAQKEFNEQLRNQRMSALARSRKIEKFRDELAAKKKELDRKVAALEGDIESKQQELKDAEGKVNAAKAAAAQLAAQNKDLSSDLSAAKEKLNAKKKLISKIAANLRRAGVKADIDKKSGDVVINFGKSYFDTGKANLKNEMKTVLEKFMPAYSKSLLSDKETAEKIKSVEIVGFASPTYKGKYVDPVSLKARDRKAAKYNLDLSYYRARSIYNYIFDKKNMTYEYQKEILPMVKVSGRSFFAEGSNRELASKMSRTEYCKKFDCKKAQRVIIKFDLGN